MRRTARRREPYHPKIQHVEVSDKNLKGRTAAAVIFLIIGVTALAFAFSAFTSVGEGWQEIEAVGEAASYAGNFVLSYELGASGVSARAENRGLGAVYSDAVLKAGRALDSDTAAPGNLRSLTDSPNTVMELDEVLYGALELLKSSGSRYMYLGPAAGIYDNVFLCGQDWELGDFDPELNGQIAELFSRIAAFASDPDSVDVELLGDGRARLRISEEYQSFLEDQELDNVVDLSWMKNAFIVDYVAERLIAGGYTRGNVSSLDGYCRNLDAGGGSYGLNVFARGGGGAEAVCRLDYTGPAALVSLRSFPVSSSEGAYYYVTQEGQVKNRFLSMSDGMPRTDAGSLTLMSKTLSCAETVLEAAPLFIEGRLDEDALSSLPGVCAVWPENGAIRFTGAELELRDVSPGWKAIQIQ